MNIMNNIYIYKIIVQEIHVLIFLQLDWMLKGTLLFFVAPAQLCVPMSEYAFTINYKQVVLESYGCQFFVWIILYIKLYL